MDTPRSTLAVPAAVSRSQSRNRPRFSRNSSVASARYLPQGPETLLPEGAISEEGLDLLQSFTRTGHVHEETLVEDDISPTSPDEAEQDRLEMMARPWYKRPSVWWLLCFMPISAVAIGACLAPRVAIYTELVCRRHRPEYTREGSIFDTFVTSILIHHHIPSEVIRDPSVVFTQPLIPNISFGNDDVDEDKDDDRQTRCAEDPIVQAAVAKLMAVMTTSMGILGCITTAFWASLSDRYGRLRVLSIAVLGILTNDFVFIIVAKLADILPGNYWLFVLGPIVEGLLGGMTTMIAANHSYIADCTTPQERTRTFSLSAGLMMIGIALGPTFGGLLINLTGQVLIVFYLATAVHCMYALLVWFFIPESLSKRAMTASRDKRANEQREVAQALMVDGLMSQDGRWGTLIVNSRAVFAFLSPLAVLAPATIESGHKPGKTRRDWNLTLVTGAYAMQTLIFASFQFKFQYAAAVFKWGPEQIGYWLTLVTSSRALFLTLVLPLILKLYNMRKGTIRLPTKPQEPLNDGPSSSHSDTLEGPQDSAGTSTRPTPRKDPNDKPLHSIPAFDLHLARVSLLLESVCYTVLPFMMSAIAFTSVSMMTAFAGGFNPAAQALALNLYAHRGATEIGKLYGAMSVLQAVSSQIIGPTLFGMTYMKTVGTYPKTIFFVSASCTTIGAILLCFVRLPKEQDPTLDVENAARDGVEREETLVNITDVDDSEGRRGRSKVTDIA